MEVMANPIVSYQVTGLFAGADETQPYETEAAAFEAAKVMKARGATSIAVIRKTTRVVNDVEEIDWRNRPASDV
jgi:hypothetical protein